MKLLIEFSNGTTATVERERGRGLRVLETGFAEISPGKNEATIIDGTSLGGGPLYINIYDTEPDGSIIPGLGRLNRFDVSIVHHTKIS